MKSTIILEQLGIEHFAEYMKYLNDPEVHKTTEPYKVFEPYEENKIKDWLNTIATKTDRKDFAILRSTDRQLMGEVVLNEIVGASANIRIGLASAYFNQGYGFQAMQQMIQYGFEKMGLTEITLSVFLVNPRGLHLYQKLGFIETGRSNYKGYDEVLMRLLKPKSFD